MKHFIKSPLFIIIFCGILSRILLSLSFDSPSIMGDSLGYIELAEKLGTFSLKGYEGWRTPGYPLVILLADFHLNIVIILQSIISILSSILLYEVLKSTHKKTALFMGTFSVLLLNSIAYDFSILTESLTCFFVILSCFIIHKFDFISLKNSYKQSLILSCILAFLFLVRPMYIYFSPVLAFFMIFHIRFKTLRTDLSKVLIVLAIPLLTYFGWNFLNYQNQNWFTTTTFLGINLAQVSYGFVEKLPDEERIIRDIYIDHKEIQPYELDNISSFKKYKWYYFSETNDAMTIWRAYDKLLIANNLTGPQLSKKMATVFKQLINDNPKDYLHQVIRSWSHFWNHSIYFKKNGQQQSELTSPYNCIWKTQNYYSSL